MSWQELSIRVPYEYVEPVSYLFGRYGRGLSMERVRELGQERDASNLVLMRTYLPANSRQRLARIEVGLKLVAILEPIEDLTITPLPEEQDWESEWRSHFDLLRVGRHLVIKPTWIDYEEGPGDVLIELDPGMAYGTGYHPTTHTCLEALEDIVKPGMAVLDVGTGSGILAITAAKLGASRVVALDIDPQAVRAARQNFRRTRVQKLVALTQGSVPHPLAGNGQFDVAVANISARAVGERAPHILPTLTAGGYLIASGLMESQRQDVETVLVDLGFTFIKEWPQEEWVTLVYRSPVT